MSKGIVNAKERICAVDKRRLTTCTITRTYRRMSGLNIMIVGLWVTFTLNIMMVALRLSLHGTGRIFDRLKIRAFRISVHTESRKP